jgi:hypothetical protein
MPAWESGATGAEEHPAARTTRPAELTEYGLAEQLGSSGFLDTLPRSWGAQALRRQPPWPGSRPGFVMASQ